MFAILIPGALPTAIPQIEGNQFLIQLGTTTNHVAVFLTTPLPEGFGAGVFISFPNQPFRLSGSLSNSKPSAIFKLRSSPNGSSAPSSFITNTPLDPSALPTISLGLMCEPLESLAQQLASLSPTHSLDASTSSSTALVLHNAAPVLTDPIELATRITKNLFNSIASFAQEMEGSTISFVDLRAVKNAYDTLVAKIKNRGIDFLANDD